MTEMCTERGLAILPIIETAVGMRAAECLAAPSHVVRLASGTLDFQVDMNITWDDDALLAFRSHPVLVSRLAGLAAPMGGVGSPRPSRIADCSAQTLSVPGGSDLAPSSASTRSRSLLDGKMIDRPIWLKAAGIFAAQAADSCLRF